MIGRFPLCLGFVSLLALGCDDAPPASVVDLAPTADLQAPDLVATPDLALPPDLTVGPDLAAPPPPSCSDGLKNGTESDADCGGNCPRCPAGRACAVGPDCETGVCQGGSCAVATCMDAVKNGGESDVDCGGACGKCGSGKMCQVADDCGSAVCTRNTCADAACTDGAKNSSETDVDCGGSCPKCADGKSCAGGPDCASAVCEAGKCAAASCGDKVKNATETDVDCGGDKCPKCAAGKSCVGGTDCVSLVCSGGLCLAATCSDKVKNAAETDVDCGGACGPCADGKACAVAGDCLSGVCDGKTCSAPSCSDKVKNGPETDVDCGGACPKCAGGKACKEASDCSSNLCRSNACVECGGVLEVSNGGTAQLAGYQVKVDAAAFVQRCGNKFSVVDAADKPVPFCVQTATGECGTDAAQSSVVWLKMSALAGGDKVRVTFLPGASSGAVAGSQVFDLYDDFAKSPIDTTLWTVVTTTCDPYLEAGRLRSGAAKAGNLSCGVLSKAFTIAPGMRLQARLEVGTSGGADSDPTVTTTRADYAACGDYGFPCSGGWFANDETPNQQVIVYNNSPEAFAQAPIRGKTFVVDLLLGANSQYKVCQTVDNACSPLKPWKAESNRVFIGAFAYEGIPWFYDWVLVRKYADPEPTTAWK